MAKNVVRNFSLFINGKKVGAAESSDYNLESGDELQVGDGEVFAVSEGVVTGSCTLNVIVPVAPTVTPTLLDALQNKKYIQLGLGLIEGKIHKVDARVKSGGWSTQMANGTLKGKWDLIFGAPTTV